jgi:outer membrane protein TolC
MFVYRSQNSVSRRVGLPAPGTLLALGLAFGLALGAASTAGAQSAELPSNPSPNPSSLSNPFFGSITLSPATDGVLKLSLDAAINRGMGTNLGLKQAEVGEIKFRAEVTEALQYFLPSITVSGATGYNQFNLAAFGFTSGFLNKIAASGIFPPNAFNGVSFFTKVDATTGQINYDQTLFSFTYIDGYKAVRAAEKSAYFNKMSARGEVLQQVATAYLAVIAAQSEVDNAKALLDADKVLLDQARAKHEAGTVANLDELRARVQYQQQQQTVVADENKREKNEILLKREIGIAPGQKIELTDPAPYSELVLRTVDDLKTEAYANRQDYQNLQAQLRETQMAVGASKAERLPTLSFKGNYGVTEVSGVGSHGTLSAVGTLKIPIFREASLRGDTQVAKAQMQSVSQQLGDLRGHIDDQVRSSLLDVQAAQQLVQVAHSNVDLATQALSDETDRFKAGIDDTLPLVQAQATLQSAQSNLVESLYQLNIAKLALARSAGVIERQYRAYLGR